MTPEAYEAALGELRDIWHTTSQRRRLCQLAEEIDAYEREHFPIPAPTPEEAAAFRAEQESGQLEQGPRGDEQTD